MAGAFSSAFSSAFDVGGGGGGGYAWWAGRCEPTLGAEMFLQRNTAGQTLTLPGTLRVIADGSAVTGGASLTWVKDGTAAASAGTLTHVSDGAFTYAPTQGETDARICGWVLSKAGAAGLAGSVRTTGADPNDATRLGLLALPNAAAEGSGGLPTLSAAQGANGTIPANVHRWLTGTPLALSSQQVQAVVPASTVVASVTAPVALATSQPNYAPAKAGDAMTLTSGERAAVANAVEAEIIDETDSEKVLEAITNKIAAANPSLAGLTLGAIAAAVRDVSNAAPAANSLGAGVKAVSDRAPGSGTLAVAADVPTAAQNAAAARDVSNASPAANSLGAAVNAILDDTGSSGVVVAPGSKSGYTLASFGFTVDTNANATELAIKGRTDLIPADPADASDLAALIDAVPTAAENAAGLLDLAAAAEGLTLRQALRLILAVLAGKSTNGGKTFRDLADTKDRIAATINASNERTAVVRDAT